MNGRKSENKDSAYFPNKVGAVPILKLKTEYKILKRESLVLLGFTVVWISMFVLRNSWFVFRALFDIIIYAYLAHLLIKILIWINRRKYPQIPRQSAR